MITMGESKHVLKRIHSTSATGRRVSLLIVMFAICFLSVTIRARAQDDDAKEEAASRASAQAAKRLSSPDPLERQRAAEELARLAAVDQQKMVAGYRLEEKNARVRLALDWALYRMGKNDPLFNVVRDLDSSRHDQAFGYLTQLDGPAPLYVFLERGNRQTTIRLVEVLGQIGDSETLARLRPYTTSFDKGLAETAKVASKKIDHRLAEPPSDAGTRSRQVGRPSETSP
jgi:hypothetical protein